MVSVTEMCPPGKQRRCPGKRHDYLSVKRRFTKKVCKSSWTGSYIPTEILEKMVKRVVSTMSDDTVKVHSNRCIYCIGYYYSNLTCCYNLTNGMVNRRIRKNVLLAVTHLLQLTNVQYHERLLRLQGDPYTPYTPEYISILGNFTFTGHKKKKVTCRVRSKLLT
jgi:hypothetical protein